jgi:uncharacterized protein GlcG (DUF336 family)
MRTATLVLGALLLSLPPGAALRAQQPARAPALPLELAREAAAAALERCEADGYRVSVAVVDAGGDLKVLLRADGAGPHTPDSSFKKAYTAASLGRPTGELARLIVDQPAAQGLRDMNESILILGGGLPIKTDGGVAGGIGVGGAPGGHLDEACARAGLEAMSGG